MLFFGFGCGRNKSIKLSPRKSRIDCEIEFKFSVIREEEAPHTHTHECARVAYSVFCPQPNNLNQSKRKL